MPCSGDRRMICSESLRYTTSVQADSRAWMSAGETSARFPVLAETAFHAVVGESNAADDDRLLCQDSELVLLEERPSGNAHFGEQPSATVRNASATSDFIIVAPIPQPW